MTFDAAWIYVWFDEVPLAGRSDDLGMEVHGTLTYDYTEDVAFAVQAAMFFPGDYYPSNQDDSATQIASSVSIGF